MGGPIFEDMNLLKKLNFCFICPDEEFRSKVCQLVYEELTSVFEFNEDIIKLHSFIKTASWCDPISLMSTSSINIINTVCSIASFYEVGLEVLRTDNPSPFSEEIWANYCMRNFNETLPQYYPQLNTEASSVLQSTLNKETNRAEIQKINFQHSFAKDQLIIEEKQ
jgi:hypothetical protein